MSAAKRHVGIQFIHSTGPKQRDDGTRKLIRRHVMLGKNLGKRRELKTGASTRASRVHDKEKRPSEKNVGEQPPRAAIPPRVGSDLSLVRFADDIDPSVMSVVLKFSHRIKAFPIEDCFIFQHKYEKWVQPLTFDAAYLNALAFSTQAFVNRPTSHQGMWTLNNVGLIHLSRTLNLLRERLGEEDHDLRLSDSTCFVVLSLAMYAQRRAEFNVAKHHMAGLSKIIELRGGVASFKGNMKLLLEIVRCDVSLTLQSGSSVIHNASIPFIQSHATETGPHSPKRSGSLSTPAVFPSMDESLAFEWNVLENFCSLINESAHQKDGLSPDVLVDTVVSPMYRLLGLKYEQHSPNEAIRLGLLSFCAGVFLHCRYLRPAGLRLSDALKSCLLHLPPASVTPQELLWLLVIGAGSVFDEEDNLWLRPWLKSTLHLCDVTSWEQTHGILKSFLWIKPVHDTLGQELIAAMVFDGGEGATSALG